MSCVVVVLLHRKQDRQRARIAERVAQTKLEMPCRGLIVLSISRSKGSGDVLLLIGEAEAERE
jgi:hypothetical protein